jgi:myo-inositol-1(or 4)-monophosphatase
MHSPREVAIAAAKEAGALLLRLSEEDIRYTMKNQHDILAEGDLQSEEIILKHIKDAFPAHCILSEEKGEVIRDSEYIWVIDPIDGTINFSRKIEEFCISIALVHRGEIVLGVLYQPVLDKLYVAEKGKGASLNEQKIVVSKETALINALVATDITSNVDKRKETFDVLNTICADFRHLRIFGSSALHLAKIAEGKLDFYFKTAFNYWDFAAGILLIEEAGGKVTDVDGDRISKDSPNIIASNGILHKAAVELVRKGK